MPIFAASAKYSATFGVFPSTELSSAAKLIAAAVDGDAKALEKLNRQISGARQEHERICSELEKLSGAQESDSDNLAAALQAAIMGNFAKDEARAAAQAIDPNKLASEYLNAGVLPSEELEASFSRFDAAMSRV